MRIPKIKNNLLSRIFHFHFMPALFATVLVGFPLIGAFEESVRNTYSVSGVVFAVLLCSILSAFAAGTLHAGLLENWRSGIRNGVLNCINCSVVTAAIVALSATSFFCVMLAIGA